MLADYHYMHDEQLQQTVDLGALLIIQNVGLRQYTSLDRLTGAWMYVHHIRYKVNSGLPKWFGEEKTMAASMNYRFINFKRIGYSTQKFFLERALDSRLFTPLPLYYSLIAQIQLLIRNYD